MTREEAREYFEHHMRFYCVTGVCREAEEMAVEEFKKEPCEDAISRQEVLDIVDGYSESRSNVEDVTQDIISDILALPPVTPNQRTGHWIDTGWKFQTDTDEILYGYGCSECGGISFFRKYDNKILGGKWCHCCCARMVEPQESGDKG